MYSTNTTTKTIPNPPTFSFEKKAVVPGKAGGLFVLKLGEIALADYQHWAFDSCGVDSLFNLKTYGYTGIDKTNMTLFEEYHPHLIEWLKTNSPGIWKPQEYLMALSTTQTKQLPKMLQHPCVKEVDSFFNKAHGPNRIHIIRISCQQDFKK